MWLECSCHMPVLLVKNAILVIKIIKVHVVLHSRSGWGSSKVHVRMKRTRSRPIFLLHGGVSEVCLKSHEEAGLQCSFVIISVVTWCCHTFDWILVCCNTNYPFINHSYVSSCSLHLEKLSRGGKCWMSKTLGGLGGVGACPTGNFRKF